MRMHNPKGTWRIRKGWIVFGGMAHLPWPAAAAATGPAQAGPPVTADGNTTAMTDIHDIKPALALDTGLSWPYWLAGALVLLAAALAWWWWQRRKRPEAAQAVDIVIPPDQEAYAALDRLAAATELTAKQFYFRLSATVRTYIERRFEFPAAEMTTEELLPRIDRLSLSAELASGLKAFCRSADPIKFAGASAQRARMARDLAFARDFVRQTTVAAPVGEMDDAHAAPHENKDVTRENKLLPET